jgi:hypothetical protein
MTIPVTPMTNVPQWAQAQVPNATDAQGTQQGGNAGAPTDQAAAGQQRFEDAMRQSPEGSGQQDAAGTAQQDRQQARGEQSQAVPADAATPGDKPAPGAAAGAEGRTGQGDRILSGLRKGRAEYRSTVDAVDGTHGGAARMSPEDLIRLQLQVTRVTLNESMAGEVGSKVDSDLQTLLKD